MPVDDALQKSLAQRLLDRAMALKPNGVVCKVREQIVEDAASGLVLQFECAEGCLRLVISGQALPMGNREFVFDAQGREAAVGTLMSDFRRPSWLRKVD